MQNRFHRAAVIVLFAAANLMSQSAVRWDTRRPLAPYRTNVAQLAPTDTVRLLGLMVQFQADDEPRTAGTGRFDSSTANPAIIDPPPHDAAYFNAKMRFVRNYFVRSSDSLLLVTGTVLPTPVTVSKTMAEYSQDNTPEFRGLARLAIESWMMADTAFPSVDFNLYDGFVLFHAGVGKDVNLIGIYGYDPAPYDMPSVYLSMEAFRSALDSTSFNGISVRNGTAFLGNTMLLPESETRVISSTQGNDTLELSINGLFAASVGSHLGLPDLFDTETGVSGIGQHGLMDGASIFAFRGIFPPEPSAWEKIELGWVKPITVTGQIDTISLPAVGLTKKDSIYKIVISNSEYFLVENRSRDPLKNGQRLTVFRNGISSILYIPKDSIGFFAYDNIRGVDGSVVDVEDLDWALIGFMDESGEFDGGGTYVWHIDEDVIAAQRASNGINSGSGTHGVVLMEADGSQDIGQSYASFEGGAGSEVGTPLDAWYLGNVALRYENKFDNTTFPNSRTNAGAASLVTMRDFSARLPRMSAIVEFGSLRAQLLPGFPKQIAGVPGPIIPFDLNNDGSSELFTTRIVRDGPDGLTGNPTGLGAVFGWTAAGVNVFDPLDSVGMIAEIDTAVIGRLAAGRIPGSGAPVLAAAGLGQLTVWNGQDVNADFRLDVRFTASLPSDTAAWTVLLNDTLVIGYGPTGLRVFGLSGSLLGNFVTGASCVVWSGNLHQFFAGSGSTVRTLTVAAGGSVTFGTTNIETGGIVSALAVSREPPGGVTVVALSRGGAGASRVTVIDGASGTISATFDLASFLTSGEEILSTLMLVDRDREGSKDIVVSSSKGRIVSVSFSGVLLDRSPYGLAISGTWSNVDLLAAELDASGSTTIMAVDEMGIARLSVQGSDIGFQSGNRALSSAALAPVSTGGPASLTLLVSDELGGIRAWDLRTSYDAQKVFWAMRGSDASGSGLTTAVTSSVSPLAFGLLPKDRVYNWPNPVYGQRTFIRLYSDKDGDVSVTIYDVAGDKITELHGRTIAGEDVEIPWDVSGIQSGVYLARVAVSAAGVSDAAIIKIAVVK